MPGLFGPMMAAQMQQPQQPQIPLPQASAQPMRKRGLFGGAADWSMGQTPSGLNRLQTIGATLRDIGQGGGDNLMNAQMLQAKRMQETAMAEWQRTQQARETAKWQAEQDQAAAQAQFGASLPDDNPYKPLIQAGIDSGLTGYANSLKPKDPEYRTVKGDLLRLGPDGSPELIYRAPADPSAGRDRPKLQEVRQWGNQYNDASRRIKDNMGNSRAAIPYASAVMNAGGEPPAGSNPRMADVQLLRAAARAQTGPGVLTESEVFGTLSPSLQQEIRRQGAYFNPANVTLTPQDRLALARNVTQGATSAANDLWREYESVKGTLDAYGVPLKEAGILPPEFAHPDDMPALSSSLKKYEVGKEYVGPTSRQYKYKGAGNWEFKGYGKAATEQKPTFTPEEIAAEKKRRGL